jgi:hypothetical protein
MNSILVFVLVAAVPFVVAMPYFPQEEAQGKGTV